MIFLRVQISNPNPPFPQLDLDQNPMSFHRIRKNKWSWDQIKRKSNYKKKKISAENRHITTIAQSGRIGEKIFEYIERKRVITILTARSAFVRRENCRRKKRGMNESSGDVWCWPISRISEFRAIYRDRNNGNLISGHHRLALTGQRRVFISTWRYVIGLLLYRWTNSIFFLISNSMFLFRAYGPSIILYATLKFESFIASLSLTPVEISAFVHNIEYLTQPTRIHLYYF